MRTTRHLLLAGTLVVTMLAAGCGGAAGGGGSDGTTTLTYWATQEADSAKTDKKIYEKIIKDFEKKTGIDVKVTIVPWSRLYKKILTATTSGQGADVVNIGNTWSASLQATGAFVEFDQQAMTKIGGKDKFVSSALKSSGTPGKTPTALPLYLLPDPVLYYNKKLFEKAGIDGPPDTWSELFSVAKKLTKDTDGDGKPDQWGLTFPGADSYSMLHRAYTMSRQAGGHFFDKQGNPTFAAPKNVQAAKRLVDRIGQGLAAPASAEHKSVDALTPFVNDKAGMMMAPLNSTAALASRDMGPDDYGITTRPVPDPVPAGGQPYRGYLSGTNISIFKSTDNKDAALKFVTFMTSKKAQVGLAKAYKRGYLPVTHKGVKALDDTGKHYDLGAKVIKHSVALPQVPEEADMETYVGDALVQLIRKAATGKVTTADIRSKLQQANKKMSANTG